MPEPRQGSSLYYSLLWTAPATRQRFIDRLQLVQALSTTLDEVQEPQVAERKIHWWHEELQRLSDGTARHPATQAVQADLVKNQAAMDACLHILTAASTARFTPPASEAGSNRLLEQSYRSRLALLAQALTENPHELNPQIHSPELARALGKHDQLTRLPVLLHRGQAVFSDELYQRFAIRPVDLASHIRTQKDTAEHSDADEQNRQDNTSSTASNEIDKPTHQALLNAAISSASRDFIQALQDPENQQHYRQGALMPLWRLSVLREKQLSLWQRNPPDLLRERSTLTPIKKLFWAWRNRR